jgi:hypothetical protein
VRGVVRLSTARHVAPTLTPITKCLLPNQEPALDLTAVGLCVFLGAITMLMLVFSQRRPRPASDPAVLAAPGGSST